MKSKGHSIDHKSEAGDILWINANEKKIWDYNVSPSLASSKLFKALKYSIYII